MHGGWPEDSGEALTGGNISAVVRVGDTLRRTAGPWTPTVHRLLRHLHARGIDWVPRPLGMTEDGREVLTYLPGTVPQYPMPSWIWTDGVLVDATARLRTFHVASRDYDAVDGVWQLPARSPVEVICHNDFAPYNLVFDHDHRITGLIDCDTAAPGPRVWDVWRTSLTARSR
jgi:Phosphotransferase enzyme family